jgi:hypothetical protein
VTFLKPIAAEAFWLQPAPDSARDDIKLYFLMKLDQKILRFVLIQYAGYSNMRVVDMLGISVLIISH